MAKKVLVLVGIGLLVIVAALLVFKGFFPPRRGETAKKSVAPTPTPTPTPKPIPTGKQTFSVSSGKKTGPQFAMGEIDPYDPAVVGTQRVSVTIRSAKPVTTVEALLAIDGGKTIKQPMKLASGSATIGIWEVSWAIPGSYAYTYNLTLKATDGIEESKVELTLR